MTKDLINLFDFEALSKKILPKDIYDFITGGVLDEVTLKRTRAVYDSIMLRPRYLIDISHGSTATTVLGNTISFPVMLDPSGGHGIAHPDGELATVKAAGSVGAGMILSSGSTQTMEEVAKNAEGPIWSQQFIYKDRGVTLNFAHRAEEAGFSAICITIDCAVPSKRERNIRNNYVSPASPYPELKKPSQSKIAVDDSGNIAPLLEPSGIQHNIDPSATWKDIEWLASNTRLPLVIKGIMTAEDAILCKNYGAKALIVSNHGCRQLDTTFATIEVLPEVTKAIGNEIEIYLDGGIRRGTDILKALAMGAKAVLIGRPIYWGLAVNGASGLTTILQILRDELITAMRQCGRPTIESIDPTLVGTASALSIHHRE